MFRVKYAIYRSNANCYDGIETYITKTDDTLEVASKLFEMSNPSFQILINFAKKEMANDSYAEGFITSTRKYISKLSNEIKDYYNQNEFFQYPIDRIPDFVYLNSWCVHKFIIEDYDRAADEEFSISDFLKL